MNQTIPKPRESTSTKSPSSATCEESLWAIRRPKIVAPILTSLVFLCLSVALSLSAQDLDSFDYEEWADADNYALKLRSVATTSDLEDQGESLVIIALIGTNLHVRIFGAEGEIITDQSEGDVNRWEPLAIVKNVLTADPSITEADVWGNGDGWDLKRNAFLVTGQAGITITGYTGDEVDVVIPEEIIGQPVTAIENRAFHFNKELTSITIPSSVSYISPTAFLRSISLASFVVAEDNSHFASVEGVLFDADLTTIVRYPIARAGDTYTIPESVTSIGITAFFACNNLTGVTIPDSVTTFGRSAFSNSSANLAQFPSNSINSINS